MLIPKLELLKPHAPDVNPKVILWLILLHANTVIRAQFIFVDQDAIPIEVRVLGNGIARVGFVEIEVDRVHKQRRFPRHVGFVQPHQFGHLFFTVLFGKRQCLGQISPRSLDRALRSGEPGVRWLVIVVLNVNQSAAELEFALPDTRGSCNEAFLSPSVGKSFSASS